MVAGAHFGRLEGDVPHARQTPNSDRYILGFHYIAAFANRSNRLSRTNGCTAEDGRRRNRVRTTKAPTRIRSDGELDAILNGDLSRVAHFVAARTVPGLFARHQNGTDAQGDDAQQMHLGWGWGEEERLQSYLMYNIAQQFVTDLISD